MGKENNRDLTPEQLLSKLKDILIKMHMKLGPGLLESAYKNILYQYLVKHGFDVDVEHPVDIEYEDVHIPKAYSIDILVNDCVIIELKAVEKLNPIHHRQLKTYLRFAKKPYGILANFNCTNMFAEGMRSWSYEDTNCPYFSAP